MRARSCKVARHAAAMEARALQLEALFAAFVDAAFQFPAEFFDLTAH